MSVASCHNVSDLRARARRRLPRGLFEFLDLATEDQLGMGRNRASLEAIRFLPDMVRDVARPDTRTELFGQSFALPFGLSAAGIISLFWHDGEIALARIAHAAGIPYCLTSYACCAIGDLLATGATIWQQLYFFADRSISDTIVEQARTHEIPVMAVTVDTASAGQREHNRRRRFFPPAGPSPGAYADMLCHPLWLATVMWPSLRRGGIPHVLNFPPLGRTAAEKAAFAARTKPCPSVTWDDLARLRDVWPNRLLIKGVVRPEIAERAIALGFDGVIVSNHGGRNLDGVVGAIDALPAIVAVAGGRVPVLFDSGVRRGSDVIKALALGAAYVMVGRPALYGLSMGGEAGAGRAVAILREELENTMALLGRPRIAELTADLLVPDRPCRDVDQRGKSMESPPSHWARRPSGGCPAY